MPRHTPLITVPQTRPAAIRVMKPSARFSRNKMVFAFLALIVMLQVL